VSEQETDKVIEIHPKPSKVRNLEDVSDMSWWTHPEIIDWDRWEKGELKRWLRTPIALKKLEQLEQKMADGFKLTQKEIEEYDQLASVCT
jgi:hypothetical protein